MISPSLTSWCHTLAFLLLLNPMGCVQGDPSSDETAEYLVSVLGQYVAYPPIDPDPNIWTDGTPIKPIDVYVLQNVLAINSIEPGSSEFTATIRTRYYWTTEDCNQTLAHQYACDTTLGDGKGLRFMSAPNAKTLPERLLYIKEENIHSTKFEEDNQTDLVLNMEQIETRGTYSMSFNMRYFPWEIHILRIPLAALYTSNIVNLVQFPGNIESKNDPYVPNGWDYLGTFCTIETLADSGDKLTDQTLAFTNYECRVAVARANAGWWWTSFLLFAALITMAYAGSVGITSHLVAEARDDRDSARRALFDGTRLVGTYTVGLLLTYVFQVQISPYGQSVEYWPEFPTSSMIYVLGLIGIIVQSFAGLAGSLVFTRPLKGDGFVGDLLGPYDFDNLPVEGKVAEDRAPLVVNKWNPNAPATEPEPPAPKEKDETEEKEESAMVAEEAPKRNDGVVDPSVARVRKNNQKSYVVLSVEEAHYVQTFVKRLFLFKTGLIMSIAICALGILVAGRVGYGNEIQIVEDFLESKGISA